MFILIAGGGSSNNYRQYFQKANPVVIVGASTSPEKLGYGVERKIAPHAGMVKSVLRLFYELVKCDTEGILDGIREAAEGK